MGPRRLIVLSTAILALMATACSFTPSAANAGSSIARVGAPAPNLRLPLLDGGAQDLVDQRGKVVLLNFWATWCTPCRQEMPELQRLADDLHDQPFTLLTVDLEEDGADIKPFLQDLGLRLPVLIDAEGDVTRSYGVRALPASFLIDPRGQVFQERLGPLPQGEVDTAWGRAWIASQVQTLVANSSGYPDPGSAGTGR